MRKLKKLFTKPHIFFRDYLNKQYPVKNTEQPYSETEEQVLITFKEKLNQIVRKNTDIGTNSIDVVYTWVDGNDPIWAEKYRIHAQSQKNLAALNAIDEARFANHNELYYSIHSVLRFLPWVRHIFIVTDNQRPDWLDESYKEKITLIDHKDIIDAKYLPTFNSHVIEAFLHKIPDLNENFIYFNDDVFVARPLLAEHFFQQNGIASIFMSEKSLSDMRKKGIITPTLSASEICIRLLKKHYQINNIDTPLVHTYIPLKKSIYKLAWQLYENEVREFLPNKVRTNYDINFANFLIPWLMYFEGKAYPTLDVCYYFNIRSPNSVVQYEKLLYKKSIGKEPHSFCANDFSSNRSIRNYSNKLIAMLDSYYK